jgi:hypothetical protein
VDAKTQWASPNNSNAQIMALIGGSLLSVRYVIQFGTLADYLNMGGLGFALRLFLLPLGAGILIIVGAARSQRELVGMGLVIYVLFWFANNGFNVADAYHHEHLDTIFVVTGVVLTIIALTRKGEQAALKPAGIVEVPPMPPMPPIPPIPPMPPMPTTPPQHVEREPYSAYAPAFGRPVPVRTNFMAVLSLVFGILGGVLGVVFGHIALHQIKRSAEGGRAMAIAGLVLGYMWVVPLLAFEMVYSNGIY